ncbi:MAG: DUF58 domain-containing protein [Planctomycetota bacterium]
MNAAISESVHLPVRRLDRPRWVTAVFFLMCMVVLLGAFASRNNVLYWFVGMAIGAVLVHGFTAGPPMMKIVLGTVDVPEMVERGRSGTARIEVVSRNRWRTARAIRIVVDLVGAGGHRACLEGGLTVIGRGETIRVPLDCTLDRRGGYDIESVRLMTTFPFGLSRKELRFECPGRIVCVPSDAGIDQGERRQLQRSAAAQSAEAQLGDIREYVPGDPRRLIAWRATARARRPLVRDLDSQRSRRIWIRCDAPSSSLAAREPAAEQVLDRAVAIGKHAAELGFRVGVLHAESGTRIMDPGGSQWLRVLAELGDRDDLVVGTGPAPGDAIVTLGVNAQSSESAA